MNTSVLEVRVARKSQEAVDVATFELVSADGRPLPSFSAGSHIDVTVPGGITRQYSLCNDPAEDDRYLIGVLNEAAGRGGSRAMHETVAEGDRLKISSPRNHFALAQGATRSLLLAGGIGITPILCMAERLAMTDAAFEMHYCARSVERMAFRRRIEQSAFRPFVRFHFDDGAPGQKLDIAVLLANDDGQTHLYLCGPKGFMEAILDAARASGWAKERLHYEFFSADVQPAQGEAPFEVKLARSGEIVLIPGNRTVVQALADAGVTIMSSCEQGVCGTCVTRVLEGEIDHRDVFLTDAEHAANDQFTPCCSRAKSKLLVLDL